MVYINNAILIRITDLMNDDKWFDDVTQPDLYKRILNIYTKKRPMHEVCVH